MNEQTTILLQKLSETLSKGINWLWEKAKGYGRMELLSYAIECEKVSNPILIAEYNRVLEIL